MTNADGPLGRRLSGRLAEPDLPTTAVPPRSWGEISFESVIIPEGAGLLAALFTWTGGPRTATIWTWVLEPHATNHGRPASHGAHTRGREVTTLLGSEAVFWEGSAQASLGTALVRFALVPGPAEIPPPLWVPGPAVADVAVDRDDDGLNIAATRQWSDLIAVDFPFPP